ncbi:GntR family transcriptional regulator [Oricola sp.]|uniref:GntR family transcriptional regulator n=1 Tax=Oricola sp. TaxID=1979950 RepID=UPI003BA9549D
MFPGPLSNRAFLSLKDAILNLAYSPGEALRKPEICEALGVSRSPVSEAITKLAAEGLVKVIPQAGTYVARFSMDEIREGAFLRESLELGAVEYLAESITPEQLALLKRNLVIQKALLDAGDVAGFYKMDAEMHRLLMEFTGFKRLGQIAETSWVHVNRARQLILPEPGRVEATIEEHRRIVEALGARDADAARKATRAHLRQLIRYLEPLERERPDLFEPRKPARP